MTTSTAAHLTSPPHPTSPPRPTRPARRTTLRLDHSRELLGLLPYQLGFHPRDSAVAVSLRGPEREVGLVSRIGLPDVLGAHGPDLLGGMAGHLARDGAGEVVLVVYDDGPDPRDPERGLRPDGSARAVRAADRVRAVLGGVAVVTVWLVTQDRYLGLDCRDPGCCPPGGRPVGDLAAGGLVGRVVARYGPVRDSRDELGEIALAGAGPRRSASAARARWVDARLRAAHPSEVLDWRLHALGAWREALSAALDASAGDDVELTPAQLGRIEAGLDDRAVRDAVVLTLVDPAAEIADDLVRHAPDGLGDGAERDRSGTGDENGPGSRDGQDAGWHGVGRAPDQDGTPRRGSGRGAGDGCDAGPGVGQDSEQGVGDDAPGRGPAPAGRPGEDVADEVRRVLGALVDPDRAREPRDDVTAAARAVLEGVVAHGRQERQAPALTLLALVSWWGGDAVRACVLVERALGHDPGYRLAEILDRALGAGLPPGWMRRRC